MQDVLAAVVAMLQTLSVNTPTSPYEKRFWATPPDSAFARDYAIEVSETDGLPHLSRKDLSIHCDKPLECGGIDVKCPSRTRCVFTKVDPYFGVARRVTIRAANTTAMKRGEPIAWAMASQPLGVEALEHADFDQNYNVIAETRTPDWIEAPPANVIREYTPPRATDLGVSGAAALECTVLASGALAACDPLSAFPPNIGLDRAAVRLAQAKYRIKEDAGPERPAPGSKVRLRIDFNNPIEIPQVTVNH